MAESISSRQVEQALKESQAHLTAIIASAMDAIVTIDRDQRIVLFNTAAEKMFNRPAAQVIGRPLDLLIPARFRAAHQTHIRRFGETGVTNRNMGRLGTLYGLRADGSEFPIEASISQIDTSAGKLYTVILRDVTQRIEAEAALLAKTDEIKNMTQHLWQAAKLASVGELAASIAHEINNPLAILSLRIESLLTALPENHLDRRELLVMEQEVDRMASLVSNLLQFSRAAQKQISTLDLPKEIDQTLELIHNHLINRRIQVQREYSADLPLIQADRQQLRQLFLNLFTNAGDAMPDGGTLSIRVRPADGEKHIWIQVRDTGHGIRPEDVHRIMDPFYTTKTEGRGTGLGLSICRRIIEEHQGSIHVTSPGAGQGTIVQITLPSKSNSNTGFVLEE